MREAVLVFGEDANDLLALCVEFMGALRGGSAAEWGRGKKPGFKGVKNPLLGRYKTRFLGECKGGGCREI